MSTAVFRPPVPNRKPPAAIALLARLKYAFDPHGVLNPGKMWETTPEALRGLSAERPGD